MEVDEDVKVIEIGNDDVSLAFFEAPATRNICVELPDEAETTRDAKGDYVGYLYKSLYGTRDVAMNW